MNPIQIAYFKHFLYDSGLKQSYLYFYRTNRIKGSPSGKEVNPISVEKFFLKTTVEDVIMKAFLFYPSNSEHRSSSYDYWKSVDEQWQAYWKLHENNFSNDKWPLLTGTFAILRQNWDVDFFWKRCNFESTAEVYDRMNIELPFPPSYWEHGEGPIKRLDGDKIIYDIHNAKEGDIVVRVRKSETGVGRTILLIRKVVRYDPETSYLSPEQLHCEWDPERKNVYIAYLHASYDTKGFTLRTSSIEREIHAVIDDDSEMTRYRLAFDGEIDTLVKELAKKGLAWNPKEKAVVPLSDAREEEQPLIDFSQEEDKDITEEFSFLDIPDSNRSRRLPNDVITVNTRRNSYRLTFNAYISEELIKNKLFYVRIARNKAGDVCLLLSRSDGCKARAANDSTTVVLSSKFHILKICELLGITEEYNLIKIKKNSVAANYISYIIYK